jgi:4-phytase/acid phosphatase
MRRALLAIAASSFAALCISAQPARQQQLQYIAVLSRHGIRTPLWNPQDAQQYAAQSWPLWDVPLGNLTARGKTQMQIMGAHDRQYLIQTGILGDNACADAPRFYFYADSLERDIESARALSAAMFPNCDVPVHGLPQGQPDPLFKPRETGVARYNAVLADAQLLARLGGKPEELLKAYGPGVEAVEEVLLGCNPGPACPPGGSSVKRLPSEPVAAISAAQKAVDTFMMEYLNAFDDNSVGWGRVDLHKLRELQKFKNATEDLTLTSYAARVNASNLLDHILLSLQQAESGKMIPGALGQPGDKALFLLGHDTDITRIARLLDLSWTLDNNPPKETPPGCALVFELWRDAATGQHTIRAYFQTPTIDQIRALTPLNLKTPPERAPLFIPACSTSAEAMPCDWTRFRRAVESAIDPAFVAP